MKISGKELIKLGYPEGRAIGMAINVVHQHFKKEKKEKVMAMLLAVLENPEGYADDEVLGRIVFELVEQTSTQIAEIPLNTSPKNYKTYGLEGIEKGAVDQMDVAVRLPITVEAALMPDAHQGYGLPIGGVLATENTVIPYGVGMDIGCRMCLTFYDLRPEFLEKNRSKLGLILNENTAFGYQELKKPMDDAIFERPEFHAISIVKPLKDKAFRQVGSSGSGNHFVEFGIVEITDEQNEFGVNTGQYLAVLSHSGSRGLGATIAKHYTDLAMKTTPLPKEAKHLAWLDLDSEAGQEYWLAMTLAGDYASVCHHHIHARMAKALGEQPLFMVENHHNFAWKEKLADGREVIVHRKGATPAGKGVLGIIPGSMVHPGYIVRGKGSPLSINSASHGAGRLFSRTKAKNSFTVHELKKVLKANGVELYGGGLDEAPMAYKDIKKVMDFQKDLVEVIGTFTPKIVRMDA
ncbi:MAG: RtcB family protein [Bacteroidales bacterium]|nr:RtcB family protein [Bacteroidales bacterium]